MVLEISDCAFGGIVPVHMGGHQLVRCVTLFLDDSVVFCDGLVVQDL